MTDHIPVHLSSSSVYPENAAYCFDLAQRLGYDGVEIMVWTDPVTQEAGALRALAELHELPIGAIHAPTLLLAQRLWGWEPWGKVERALDLAAEVGAGCVVVHPPFRWQRGYAEGFVEGVAERQRSWGVKIAVENMFPWRSGVNAMQAYLPGPDPRDFPYGDVTLDISHAATAGTDALELAQDLGDRVTHLHLGDSFGSFKDEHLVPGRGNQKCAEVLDHLVQTGFEGVVSLEVGTRRLKTAAREEALAESLAYAREHLGQHDLPGARPPA
ncbi:MULTISPECIES: sugar phosphate isomerase/epimerase family protein [unclassified Ornithinimicrobium]|uniref:sugar phosphate isomerase/epimerase family protein n=1 Tax=unclassified Ornithinimicrobium TaxID=2615080 RepID=UPI00385263FD